MDNLIVFLNPIQLQAVTHRGSPLLVLAGAGSGKTRVVTTRVAHLIDSGEARPDEILAVTFTNKAAAEMRVRVNSLIGERTGAAAAVRVWIHTFHAFCARLLRREIGKLPRLGSEFVIATQADQLAILKRLVGPGEGPGALKPEDVLAVIERAKHNLVGPEQFPAHTPRERLIGDFYARYQAELQDSGALDYADLILVTVRIFREYPEVLERWRKRFRHILVDEYQDTNAAQHELIRLLASGSNGLCVVGDPDQSIYRWRGADPENILRVTEDFENVRVISLLENYRSTQTILKAANSLISHNPRPLGLDKELWTRGEEGEPISVYAGSDEYDESGWIATEIFRAVNTEKRANYAEFAILYRTNAQSRVLEDALRKRSIPYTTIAGSRFYDRREIRDLLAYLRLLVNPNDILSFRRIINVPSRGVGKISVDRVMEEIEKNPTALGDAVRRCVDEELIPPRARRAIVRLMDLLGELTAVRKPVDRLLENLIERVDYTSWLQKAGDAVSRLENVEEFVETAHDFVTSNPEGTLEEFLEEVSLAAPIDDFDETAGSVSLLTLHAAKGLEFPIVFISGVEEGLVPLKHRGEGATDDVEEERRLFYVGLTRAEYKAYFTRALRRNLEGRKVWTRPSGFLKELPARLLVDHSVNNLTMFATSQDLLAVEHEQEREKAEKLAPAYSLGDRVWHDKWGRGIILSRAGDGDSLKLTVKFARHGIKKLVAKYANLQKM
jgi:DNA helicase-2/ATP-dependent DNA helicase PcrA